MNYIEWAKREIEYAKLVEHAETAEIKDEDEQRREEILNDYTFLVYDCALELLKKFAEQNHSGMSAQLTLGVFTKLAKWQPLTPLTGDENEWSNFLDGPASLGQQNLRDSSVFRDRKSVEEPWAYSYNRIVEIVNGDEVWEKYPPYDDPGSLDDDNPSVKRYFDGCKELRDKHNAEITFPYTPHTFKYRWNFTTEEFEAVE